MREMNARSCLVLALRSVFKVYVFNREILESTQHAGKQPYNLSALKRRPPPHGAELLQTFPLRSRKVFLQNFNYCVFHTCWASC